MSEEAKLFEAPDLGALQRDWPRVALRGGALVLVPLLAALLATATGLADVVASLPLPLEFLEAGPFAYGAKVVFTLTALLLGLAFFLPKRTPALVMGLCVVVVLWTGHVFVQLQWTRLFAPGLNLRRDASPEPAAWLFGALLLAAGAAYLVLDNLLQTRGQQQARGLVPADTDAALRVSSRVLGQVFAAGAAVALALGALYLALRALLDGARLPFRLNPVFALLAMGAALALLVALAVARRPAVATFVPAPAPQAAATSWPASSRAPPIVATPADAPALVSARTARRRLTRLERASLALAALVAGTTLAPWKTVGVFPGSAQRETAFGLALPAGWLLLACLGLVLWSVLRARGRWARFGPLAGYAGAFAVAAAQWMAAIAAVVAGDPAGVIPRWGIFLAAFLSLVGMLLGAFAAFSRWRSLPGATPGG